VQLRVVASILLAAVLAACSSEDTAVRNELLEIQDTNASALNAVPGSPQNLIPQLESALQPDEKIANAVPTRLKIDNLGVISAPIKPVGVETNGDYEVPGATTVGWYKFGAGPGGAGSTVLAAHIAYQGQDGVFRNLSKIDIGSIVDVTVEDGSVISYEITETNQYDKQELPFDEIFERSGDQQLVLITCGGDFNASVSSYEDNFVAYGKPI